MQIDRRVKDAAPYGVNDKSQIDGQVYHELGVEKGTKLCYHQENRKRGARYETAYIQRTYFQF